MHPWSNRSERSPGVAVPRLDGPITLDPIGLTVTFDLAAGDIGSATALIRRWFDLDANSAEVDLSLARDLDLGLLVSRRLGLRMTLRGWRDAQRLHGEIGLGTSAHDGAQHRPAT